MTIRNENANKVYQYIYIHSGETILVKDIEEWTGLTRPTVIKYIRWLIRRNLIQKIGTKVFQVVKDY